MKQPDNRERKADDPLWKLLRAVAHKSDGDSQGTRSRLSVRGAYSPFPVGELGQTGVADSNLSGRAGGAWLNRVDHAARWRVVAFCE